MSSQQYLETELCACMRLYFLDIVSICLSGCCSDYAKL